MKMKESLYCVYDNAFELEHSIGALRIYLPIGEGFVNYNIAHSVKEDRLCDVWRLSRAFITDSELKNPVLLNPNAEWDMAVLIRGREDFIGGYLHGDEVFTKIRVFLDGSEMMPESISTLAEFSALKIQVDSVGYDPDDHKTEALHHYKEYTVTESGIALEQKVEWLHDYEVGSSYLAMMPPLKSFTDSYYTDLDSSAKRITGGLALEKCKSATLFGEESRIFFRMSIPKYPSYESGSRFLVTDNGGNPYNKMYFRVCENEKVKSGEIWESLTEYSIGKC